MKDNDRPCAARGCLVIATLALSGVLVACADPASAQGCRGGALSPSAGNVIGSVVGAAAGGLLGSQFGHGAGKGLTTGVGVIGGALAGGYVGRSMEGCEHEPARATAQSRHRHREAASARAANDARSCRFVSTPSVIDGREERVDGVACLDADGNWKMASDAGAEQAAQRDLVLRTQQRLHEEGFYVRGNVDGKWGPATSSALGNFQRAKGLPASGQFDVSTQSALGLDPAPIPAAPTAKAGSPDDAKQVPPPAAVSAGDTAPPLPGELLKKE